MKSSIYGLLSWISTGYTTIGCWHRKHKSAMFLVAAGIHSDFPSTPYVCSPSALPLFYCLEEELAQRTSLNGIPPMTPFLPMLGLKMASLASLQRHVTAALIHGPDPNHICLE
jgi:hypothetical protein